MDDALRAIGDTNTAIYSLAFSSGKADAAHYADRELPIHSGGSAGGVSLENAHPGPPHGCMGKDPDPDATTNKAVQAFDCLGLLAPPLALAKLAAIRAADGLERNVPETVAQLTGGEYFHFEDSRSLVRGLLTIFKPCAESLCAELPADVAASGVSCDRAAAKGPSGAARYGSRRLLGG